MHCSAACLPACLLLPPCQTRQYTQPPRPPLPRSHGCPPLQMAAQARQVLAACEKSPSDAQQLNYDPRNPFDICSLTFTPIYRGNKVSDGGKGAGWGGGWWGWVARALNCAYSGMRGWLARASGVPAAGSAGGEPAAPNWRPHACPPPLPCCLPARPALPCLLVQFVEDPYTKARFQPEAAGQISPVGDISQIGLEASGLVSSPTQLR